MIFSQVKAVWIEIGDEASNYPYRVTKEAVEFVEAFVAWQRETKTWPLKTWVVGGGIFVGMFSEEAAPTVLQWLRANGAIEGAS